METILATVFSAIIIFMTVFFIIKASNIAYKKREMAIGKLIFISAASIAVGIAIVSVSLSPIKPSLTLLPPFPNKKGADN